MDIGNQAYTLGFKSVGRDAIIWPLAKIVSPEVISIGDSVIIDDFVFIMGGKQISIGSFVHIASFSSITGGGEFIIEDFSGLSSGIRVYTGNEDYSGGSLTNPAVPFPYRLPTRSCVHIKKHVIIGANTVILPGVTIREGVAVGANSLVTENCEPWTVYAGSPAKAIRARSCERVFKLEADLRRELYDDKGCYVPKNVRSNPKSF